MAKTKSTPKTSKTKSAKGESKKTQSSLISENSKVAITLSKKIAQAAYQQVLKKMAKNLKSDGFRKGNVPVKIAEEQIGPSKIIDQVLRDLLPTAYQAAVKKNNKKPISSPEFEAKKIDLGSDWELVAHFAEIPEFKLGNYKKTVKTAKKEAAEALKKAEKLAKKADSKTKDAKKGKDQKTPQKPTKLTDEQKKQQTLQFVFRGLATSIKPVIPSLLLKEETRHEFERLLNSLKQFKMELADYLKNRKMTQEQLSNDLAVQSLGRLQLDFILGAIAKEQNFKATDKEIDAQLEKVEDKKMRESLKTNQNYRHQLTSSLIRQKVVDYLLEI